MSRLASRAPRPPLAEHPALMLMLLATMERFHCTLGEVREDYWLGRAWRALAGDPALVGRVARVGLGNVLLTGPGHGPMPGSARERARWRRHVLERLAVDTAHTPDSLDLSIGFADQAVEVAEGCTLSLLAQTVVDDPRWDDLTSYASDLAPVVVPVAYTAEAIVAA